MLILGSVILSRISTFYNVVHSYTNCFSNNEDEIVTLNSSYSAKITPSSGYKYCGGLIIMGGVDITSDVYDMNTGLISIPKVTGDIEIKMEAISTFANTSWFAIRNVAQNNLVSDVGWNIGDTKSVGNASYTARICDTLSGRYSYYDNEDKKTNIVIEFIETYPSKVVYNSSGSNTNGWSGSYLRTFTNTTILQSLPEELTSVLDNIKIPCSTRSQGVLYSSDKLFSPAGNEIGLGSFEGSTSISTTQFGYYQQQGINARKKYPLGGGNSQWWSRDVNTYNAETFSLIQDGSGIMALANSSRNVGIYFAW